MREKIIYDSEEIVVDGNHVEYAIINNDLEEFQKYKMDRERAVRDQEILRRVDSLEKEIANIKKILLQIHNRLG